MRSKGKYVLKETFRDFVSIVRYKYINKAHGPDVSTKIKISPTPPKRLNNFPSHACEKMRRYLLLNCF